MLTQSRRKPKHRIAVTDLPGVANTGSSVAGEAAGRNQLPSALTVVDSSLGLVHTPMQSTHESVQTWLQCISY